MSFHDLMWWLSANYRKGAAEGYLEQYGRPHPQTPEGKRWDAAEAQHRATLKNPPQVHGSARWISRDEIFLDGARIRREMADPSLFPDALYLGRYLASKDGLNEPEAYSFGPGHLLTIAGTRAGKGVAQIVPNLLVAPHPMVVIDPKGENYGITAAKRAAFGPVFRFDPFKTTAAFDRESPFARYNPLSFIRDDADARRLASMLLGDAPANREGNATFFYNEAVNALTALILSVARSATPTMASLRRLAIATVQTDSGELQRLTGDPMPTVANMATLMMAYSPELRASVVAQINSATGIWDNEALQEATSACDFDLFDLKRRAMTVYVVLPFDRMETHRGVLRMMLGQFLSAMLRDPQPARIPVMCFVDEFPSLGRLDEIVRALGEIAGMNVRLWLFAQSLSRLRALYGENTNAILANCATQCFFGVSDGETAQWISDQLGKRTRSRETTNFSANVSAAPGQTASWLDPPHAANSGFNKGIELFGEPLMPAQLVREELGVGTGYALLMRSGAPPAILRLGRWFADPVMAKEGRDIRNIAQETPPAGEKIEWGMTPVRRAGGQ